MLAGTVHYVVIPAKGIAVQVYFSHFEELSGRGYGDGVLGKAFRCEPVSLEVFSEEIESFDNPAYDLVLLLEIEFGCHLLQCYHELGAVLIWLVLVASDESTL